MVAVLYNRQYAFPKQLAIFEAITAGHLYLSPLRSAFALDTWAHLLNLKKEMDVAN